MEIRKRKLTLFSCSKKPKNCEPKKESNPKHTRRERERERERERTQRKSIINKRKENKEQLVKDRT